MDYDVLIVGAGPAGCAAAYDLAHAGRRVLLLDKRSFPRGKACACGLTRKTLKALRYSVEPVLERQCRDVVLQEAGPAFLQGGRLADKSREVRVRLRQPFCAMAVRERFDAFCLEQTLAHGSAGCRPELRKIEGITALRELPTGIELDITLPGGTAETLRAPALIGADGSNGQTRRLATGLATSVSTPEPGTLKSGAPSFPASPERVGSGAPPSLQETTAAQLPPEPAWYARGFALEATVPYTALPAQLPAGDAPLDLVFDFAPIAGGYGWLFPKGDHINIGVGGFVPQTTAQSANPATSPVMSPATNGTAANTPPDARDPAMTYESVTRALLHTYARTKLGVDLAALPNAHVTGQHLGLGGHAYIPQGRILLTGDAAGLVDPLTGEGIHSALVSGQAAAAAILESLPPIPNASSQPHPTPDRNSRPERSAVERLTYSPTEPQNPGAPSFPASPESRGPHQLAGGVERVGSGAPQPPRDTTLDPTCPETAGSAEAQCLAAAYTRHLAPLRETLTFSHRAARSFYREPERGFRVMRTPLLRSLVLKTYADGLPTTKLLAKLARRVA